MRRHFHYLAWAILGTGLLSPVAALLFTTPNSLFILAGVLGVMGWIVAAIFLLDSRGKTQLLSRRLGLETADDAAVIRKLTLIDRQHRAGFSVRVDEGMRARELEQQIERLLKAIFQDYEPVSVELSLYDEASQRWSRAFLVGVPKTRESQAMLSSEEGNVSLSFSTGILRREDLESNVIIAPVRFAGAQLGELRIELQPEREVSAEDEKIATLFGKQAAYILANGEFTRELYRLRLKSEESIQAKTGFLANLSHEIRGPLGIILNGAELAIDGLCGPLTDSLKETMRMIKTNGEHLLDLVNDVLDYAKVESGKIQVKSVPIEVKALLEDLTTVVRSQAVSKNHQLILKPVDPQMGLLCDKRHARQMLINFLTNAIKYTPEGGKIEVWAEYTAQRHVKILIRDSGIGIPEDQRSKVFGAFERVDHKYALAQVGTGLGMPLAKRLAEANRGTVDFDSVEGKGSTFWLILPSVSLDEVESNVEERGDGSKRYGNGETLLIVDHDPESRQMLSTYLTHQGFNVLPAANGREVMKHLRDSDVRLAIVENDLPDITGEEMVMAIRANPKATSIPVVMLSARAFVFDIERFLKMGVDRCLSKPVELIELAHTSRRLLDEASRDTNTVQ